MEKRPFDVRVFERYRDKGIVTEQQVKDHLKALPDETNNAQWVEMELHEAEISSDSINDMDDEDFEDEDEDLSEDGEAEEGL